MNRCLQKSRAKSKNTVGSQSRGAGMRYKWRICSSYFTAHFLTNWRYYKSSTEKTWITFLGIFMTCRAVLAILFLLSVHKNIHMQPFKKISLLCKTSYTSVMSEVSGKAKIASKCGLFALKLFYTNIRITNF